MTDTASKSQPKRSGLRRRGHLLRGLRTLVNDPKATAKQRLEASRMLFALETNSDYRTVAQPAKLKPDKASTPIPSALFPGDESKEP